MTIHINARNNDDGTVTLTIDDDGARWIAQQMLYRAAHFVECANRFSAVMGDDGTADGARQQAERCRGVSTIIGACVGPRK